MAIHMDYWSKIQKAIYAGHSKFLDREKNQESIPPENRPVPGLSLYDFVEAELFEQGIVHKEDQESTYKWISETFPEYDTFHNRLLAVFEECIELMWAGGFSSSKLHGQLLAVINKLDLQEDKGTVPEEGADLLNCLYGLAGFMKFDLHAEHDRKMVKNRSRTKEQYREKVKQKLEQGLRLEEVK